MLGVTLQCSGNWSGWGVGGIVILLFMLKWNRDKFRLGGSISWTMEARKASFNLVKLLYGWGFLTLVIYTLCIEELCSESWKTKPKLLKQPIRRTVYIIICQRELKVKTSELLREKKKGNEQVANVILHPIGWEDGSSFLGQSTSRVQRNLSNRGCLLSIIKFYFFDRCVAVFYSCL